MQKTLSVISTSSILKNARLAKAKVHGKKFFAVVKADAYGHGAVRVANLLEPIVDGFCVAIMDEGVELRLCGITKPILVFCPPLGRDDIIRARHYRLDITASSSEVAASSAGLNVHIKVNTGMNRLGVSLADLPSIIRSLKGNFVGIYSHLYAPDDEKVAARQTELFKRAQTIAKAVNPNICAHLSASGGILRGDEFDGVRCGILLYGYTPNGFKDCGFTPALKVYARKIQDTKYIAGGVGYQKSDKAYDTLSTYRLGYGDGFFRGVPLGEGKLCMDAFILEKCEALQGKQLRLVMDNAKEYAQRAGTISYEVLTSVTKRSERIYVGDNDEG